MKKVFVSLLIALFAITLASCSSEEVEKAETEYVGKISKKVVKEIQDPVFKDSEDFINNIITNKERQRYMAVVNRLTLSEINEMAKVIIHREGYVDWKLFLKEYDQSYQRVYRYLEEPPTTPDNTKIDTIVKVGSKDNNLNVIKNGTTNVNSSIQRQ